MFSTFLGKITKYNRLPLGFDPSVARLLGHDPTPRPTCPDSIHVYNQDETKYVVIRKYTEYTKYTSFRQHGYIK